jgi:hypothetical protein
MFNTQRTTVVTKILLLLLIALAFTQAWMLSTSSETIRKKSLAKRHGASYVSHDDDDGNALQGTTTDAAIAAVV